MSARRDPAAAEGRRTPEEAAESASRDVDAAIHVPREPSVNASASAETNGAAHAAADSVLKQFQLAVEAAKSEGSVEPPAAAPRVSRRQQAAEQLKEVSERPFVQRAMELFEVAPGQFRYTPPTTNEQD